MIRRLFYASLKLDIHIKSLRAKTLYIPWQYFIPCYNSGTKLCQKKNFQKHFELDYTFLLEVPINPLPAE